MRLMSRRGRWVGLVSLACVAGLLAGCQRAASADPRGDAVPDHPFPQRAKAPSLDGGIGWLNTAGPIRLADLKGKFVVLDFWTYCCINCIHILPELKKLERAYPHEIVVIGVHSAKFDAEQDSQNIAQAIQRYEIEHPVVNDADRKIWDRYGVDAWPSLRIIDPEGNLVAQHSSEFEFPTLDGFFKRVLPYYEQRGLLDRTPVRFDLEAQRAKQTPLRFPAKILADEPSGRLFISDSNHNRIVIAGLDGKLVDVIGSGAEGTADGDFATAQFNQPQGMALRGDTLYLADTENHLLRKVDLAAKRVTTIAGVGKQARAWPGLEQAQRGETSALPTRFAGPPTKTALNSPWDLCIVGNNLYIAMAGPHQIWKMPLDEREIGVYAGNGREDIVDGPLVPAQPYALGFASFAQPSGLATDGRWLYVADSEGSSIRAVPLDPKQEVRTVVGTADLPQARLFTFGDRDGGRDEVRLQHPLGIAYRDGLLYVVDTYNSKIKIVDPAKGTAKTFSGGAAPAAGDRQTAPFHEPSGIAYAAGKWYIADTNSHAIRIIDAADGSKATTLEIIGLSPPPAPAAPAADSRPSFPRGTEVSVASQAVKADSGRITLGIKLRLPEGFKINTLAPMSYLVEGVTESGPVDRAPLGKAGRIEKPAAAVEIPLAVSGAAGSDTIKVSLNINYCRDGAEGLCKMATVAWTVPLEISGDATDALVPLEFEVK